MLHITNGESVTGTFRQVRFPGTYLAWKDVLHDGPVPSTSTLSELSDVRARALTQFGWGNYAQIRSGFAVRDHMLEDFRKHEDVVLWFEHDLLDQLQLIQLLDWFSAQDEGKTRLSLIQINAYPGVKPFYGLGQLSGTQLARLFPKRQSVTARQLVTAHEAWQAFRAPDPGALAGLTQRDFPEMPFLRAALVRFCQEYPGVQDGLSRSQHQILRAAADGHSKRQEIYQESQKLDVYPWGDASVYLRIDGLASGPNPAIMETKKNEYAITDHGRQLLEGKADWIKLNGAIDVWLGGVHLTGQEASWRWDEEKQTLAK
jgi:hypothetical protein